MRIVCPNCTSQYEVSEDAIPEAGRDVQCANCSEIWFQGRPMQLNAGDALSTQKPDDTEVDHGESVAEVSTIFRSLRATQTAQTPETQLPKQRQRPTIDPEVQRILQEEAAFAEQDATVETREEPPVEPELNNDAAAPHDTTAPINVEDVARRMQEMDDVQEADVPTEPAPKEDLTLSSAKSLREILEAESIDPTNIAETTPTHDAMDTVADVDVAETKPALDDLSASAVKEPVVDIQTDTVSPPPPTLEPEKFLGDLGKRPVQIDIDKFNQDDDDLDVTPIISPASKPMIRPASDFIKNVSSLVKRSDPDENEPLNDDIKFGQRDDELDAENEKIALAPTTQAKSGKAVFTDIDDINTKLDLDDDDEDDADDSIDLKADDVKESSNRFSMGFLAACGVALLTTLAYMFAPAIGGTIPATEPFMTKYETSIDNGRMVLQDMYYQGGEPGFSNLFQNAKSKLMN